MSHEILNKIQPPENEIVHRKHDDGSKAEWTPGITELNEKTDWAIIRIRAEDVLEEDSRDFIEAIDPEFEDIADDSATASYYNTWQEAADQIRKEYDQPTDPNEHIIPAMANHVSHSLNRIALAVETDKDIDSIDSWYSGDIPESIK